MIETPFFQETPSENKGTTKNPDDQDEDQESKFDADSGTSEAESPMASTFNTPAAERAVSRFQVSDENTADPVESPKKRQRRRRKQLAAYQRWERKHHIRIVAYVNSKSGGKQGQAVLKRLGMRLPRNQVHDLFVPFQGVAHTLQGHIIEANSQLNPDGDPMKIRILACGGDGTVGWIAADMEKVVLDYVPSMALLPLGTGNDLAKVLRWRRFFDSIEAFHVRNFLRRVIIARPSRLDRWKLRVLTADVTNRDELPMFVPSALRKTTSIVGGSTIQQELDRELRAFQLSDHRAVYQAQVEEAQREAAQWFEEKQEFEAQKVRVHR